MAKHHPDLIFCRKQAGVGKLIFLLKNFEFYCYKIRNNLQKLVNHCIKYKYLIIYLFIYSNN